MGDGFLATGGSEPRSLAIQASHLTEQIASFSRGLLYHGLNASKVQGISRVPVYTWPCHFSLDLLWTPLGSSKE